MRGTFHKKYPNIKLLLSNYIRSEHLFMYDCDFCITTEDNYTPMVGNCLVRLSIGIIPLPAAAPST